MSTGIRFRWTLNRADHLDLLRSSARLVRFAPLFAAVLAVAGVVLLVLGQWLPGAFGVVLAVVIVAVPYGQAQASLRGYPLAGQEIRGSADAAWLRLDVAGHARSELSWDRIQGWSDTGRTIVVRTADSAGGYPIPRRAFDNNERAEEFVELLRDKVGPPSRSG